MRTGRNIAWSKCSITHFFGGTRSTKSVGSLTRATTERKFASICTTATAKRVALAKSATSARQRQRATSLVTCAPQPVLSVRFPYQSVRPRPI